jgi:hypothetical protein
MIKMKLCYMAWRNKKDIVDLFIAAIDKTLEYQKKTLISELKAYKVMSELSKEFVEIKNN